MTPAKALRWWAYAVGGLFCGTVAVAGLADVYAKAGWGGVAVGAALLSVLPAFVLGVVLEKE